MAAVILLALAGSACWKSVAEAVAHLKLFLQTIQCEGAGCIFRLVRHFTTARENETDPYAGCPLNDCVEQRP
jgi:hypothetical protein